MSKQKIRVNSLDDVQQYKKTISQNLVNTSHYLRSLASYDNHLDVLKSIRFHKDIKDILFNFDTNFVEFINQSFTYMIMLIAVERLLQLHPQKIFEMNYGTQSGYDIVSQDMQIICECFASTTPQSNEKLKKDMQKVFQDEYATYKYVAYYSENTNVSYVTRCQGKYSSVTLLPITWDELAALTG